MKNKGTKILTSAIYVQRKQNLFPNQFLSLGRVLWSVYSYRLQVYRDIRVHPKITIQYYSFQERKDFLANTYVLLRPNNRGRILSRENL